MVGVPREKAKGHKHVDIAGLMRGPKIGPSERALIGGHHMPVLWLSSALGPVLSSLTLEDIKAKPKLGRQVGGHWGAPGESYCCWTWDGARRQTEVDRLQT